MLRFATNAGLTGSQGRSLSAPGSVLATAKRYIGDGGTTGGDDQGNTEISEAELRAIHLPPFAEAVRRGVGSVMISYSSWNDIGNQTGGWTISRSTSATASPPSSPTATG
jgi:beta-glucosidase